MAFNITVSPMLKAMLSKMLGSHNMTIIEVEGTNVQPLQVDSLTLFAGMRSFLYHLVSY